MKDAYLWIDYTSMPQPLASVGASPAAAAAHAGMVEQIIAAPRRMMVVARLIANLKAAVDSIELCRALCRGDGTGPPVAHVDRRRPATLPPGVNEAGKTSLSASTPLFLCSLSSSLLRIA